MAALRTAKAPPASAEAGVSAPVRTRRPARRPLVLIVAAFLLIGGWYSVATPILEVSDESAHEAAIWWIAAGHGLPVMDPSDPRHFLVPAQEAGQPPLYDLLAAASTFWLHAPAPLDAMVVNPMADLGSPDYNTRNRNLFLHGPDEAFPWTGLALAAHLHRLLSLLFGAVAVASVYRLARLALPRNPTAAALAAALAAFNPMLLFMAASGDNDALAFGLSSAVLALLAAALVRGLSWRRTLLTGGLLGLAVLSKLNAAAVGLAAAGAYAYLGARRPSRPAGLLHGAAVAGVALLVSGWWFARNWLLYRDPLALSTFVAIAGPRARPLSVAEVLREAPAVWYSFWGVFGNFSILLPPPYYRGYALLAQVAAAGLLVAAARWALRRRPPNPVLALLAGWAAIALLALARWTAVTSGSTGRLLLPAIGSIAVFLALGLTTLLRLLPRGRPAVAAALVGALGLAAALVPPVVIQRAYPPPEFVPVGRLAPERRLDLHYGNLALVGVSAPQGPIAPGAAISVTLYWRAEGPIATNYAEGVILGGPDRTVLTAADAAPGNTEVATSRWPAGQGLIDRVPLVVPGGGPAPIMALLRVSVYPLGHPERALTPSDAAGRPVNDPTIARLEIRRTPVAPPAGPPPLATFGPAIQLAAASAPSTVPAGGILDVHLRWLALARPDGDRAEVARLVAADGSTAARIARQPHDSALPTSDWVAGEQVDDDLPLPIAPAVAPGRYTLRVGLAPAQDGAEPTAVAAPDVAVGQVTVQPPNPPPAPAQRLGFRYGNLELLGATLPQGPLAPGSEATVSLVWRAAGPIADDDVVSVQLRGPDGLLVAQADARPSGRLRTAEWPPGWTEVERVSLRVDARSPAPAIAHAVVIVYPAGRPAAPVAARLPDGGADAAPEAGRLELRGDRPSPPPQPLPLAVDARFAGVIRLLGAALPATITSGQTAAVRLQWQALQSPAANYTVFIHATDRAGRLAFQADSQPHGGRLPTTDWAAGEIVDDALELHPPPGTVPGAYRLSVGLYELRTGRRLARPDGSTEVELGRVLVQRDQTGAP